MEQKMDQTMREDPRAWNDSRERTRTEPAQVKAVAKAAGLAERWREARPSKKMVFGLSVAVVALTMLVGFNWGGWVTGGDALKRADTRAQEAIVARLGPICVAQFNKDPQKVTQLAALKAITSSYSRSEYVAKQGWATMPGEKSPNSDVANACAKLLIGS